jgi:Glycosyl transferase family 2
MMPRGRRETVTLQTLIVSLHDRAIELRYPAACAGEIKTLFGATVPRASAPHTVISVEPSGDGRYSIIVGLEQTLTGLTKTALCSQLVEEIVRVVATDLSSAVALHAGAVGWNSRSILFPGASGAGKSSLVAWFVDKGFSYLTDELAVVADAAGGIVGFPRALVLKPDADKIVAGFSCFRAVPTLRAEANLIICPPTALVAPPNIHPCGLIVFATYVPGAALSIEPLSAGMATLKMMGCNGNARNLSDGGIGAIGALAQSAAAIVLRYGSFAQLESLADVLAKFLLDGNVDATRIRQFLSAASAGNATFVTPPVRHVAIPAPTPRRNKAKLTIGMATYDDYDGVYFSLQALRLYHPEILDQTEFVVIDNHPHGTCAEALKAFENWFPNYRYVPENMRSGTAVRNAVFAEASGDFVLCMDCHVLIIPGAVKRLLEYFDRNDETLDLLQGPLLYDDLKKIATHFSPVWGAGMYGRWDDNGLAADPDAEPFDIPMQGLGLFACRRAAWPGFNPAFRGFGAEEGYIHEKFRRAGGRTLCLPFLRWVHRFRRPQGVPYRNDLRDRMWNYTIGFRELSLPTGELQAHFRELLGANVADAIFAEIEDELSSP